ncbi:MAG: hypothetical protein LC799_28505 [Actinobacteria bacterium]|nr:hypothetical protein [Actinomycetota bacterium]
MITAAAGHAPRPAPGASRTGSRPPRCAALSGPRRRGRGRGTVRPHRPEHRLNHNPFSSSTPTPEWNTGHGRQHDDHSGPVYDQAVPAVTQAPQEQGFGVLTEIDAQAPLKEKLVADMAHYIILGAC